MKNENEWVSLNDDGTIWVYCGPGTNNVLGLVIRRGDFWWDSETRRGTKQGHLSSYGAGMSVEEIS